MHAVSNSLYLFCPILSADRRACTALFTHFTFSDRADVMPRARLYSSKALERMSEKTAKIVKKKYKTKM